MGKHRVKQQPNQTTTPDYKNIDITPLLGVNWLKQLPITINGISLNEETNQSERAMQTNFKSYLKQTTQSRTLK